MASGTLDTPAGTAPTPSAGPNGNGRAAIPARTLRTDNWRKAPIITVTLLTLWIMYAMVRVFMQKWYWVEDYHYLTPFYSPCVSNGCDAATRRSSAGSCRTRRSSRTPRSRLPFLLLFRLTCYYYRHAYYRSFWLSPPACAVPDGHKTYTGETRFPLIFQNLHRYFFYAAVLISLINTWDAVLAFHGTDGLRLRPGQRDPADQRGAALGLHASPATPAGTSSAAGSSTSPSTRSATGPGRFVSKLNTRHMELAWITLGTLALTDFYVMAVAAGWFSDLRFIN